MNDAGMYVLGLPFTRYRNSSFLDGVGRDAFELAAHLAHFLDTTTRSRPADARRATMAS
jgi:putative flavoprotein involved in K+ transport